MLNRIFPKAFDNVFRGHWLGLWLFVPVVLLKLIIGVNSVRDPREIASSVSSSCLAFSNCCSGFSASSR
jgi:hypothetical protein